MTSRSVNHCTSTTDSKFMDSMSVSFSMADSNYIKKNAVDLSEWNSGNGLYVCTFHGY